MGIDNLNKHRISIVYIHIINIYYFKYYRDELVDNVIISSFLMAHDHIMNIYNAK